MKAQDQIDPAVQVVVATILRLSTANKVLQGGILDLGRVQLLLKMQALTAQDQDRIQCLQGHEDLERLVFIHQMGVKTRYKSEKV